MSPEHLIVLTGPPGSGKTTCCRGLAAAAARRGLVVRGLLAVVEPGSQTAAPGSGVAPTERWLEDLGSGDRRLLGRETPPDAAAAGEPRWRLFDDTLAWGNGILCDACPTDVLVVDEVGPVELLHRRGWLAGLQRALGGPYRLAVVVVRPWLVPRFRQLQPGTTFQLVDAREANAARAIVGHLGSLAATTGVSVHASGGAGVGW